MHLCLSPMPFNELGLLPELLSTLKPKTYPAPTPVQSELIPFALDGRDVWVTAPTGSGKTLAYALPLIHQLLRSQAQNLNGLNQAARPARGRNAKDIQSLVLVPTRELAIQVSQLFMSLTAQWASLCKITVVFGGVSINPQMMGLRGGTDILIATPGRLLDLIDHNALKLSTVQTLVLDEADKLLELGFQEELHQILKLLPAQRQNLFLSATRPQSIESLARSLLNDPHEIQIVGATPQPTVIQQRAIYTETTK